MKKLLLALVALLLCSCGSGWYPNDTTFSDEQLEEQEIQEEASINETIEADPCQQDMLYNVPLEYSRCVDPTPTRTRSTPTHPPINLFPGTATVMPIKDPVQDNTGCLMGDDNSTDEVANIVAAMGLPAPYTWSLCGLKDNPEYEEFRKRTESEFQEIGYLLFREYYDDGAFNLVFTGDKTIHLTYLPATEEYSVLVLTVISAVESVQRTSPLTLSCAGGCSTHVEGCDIKGNISVDSGEKIYHVPGQEYYNETVIDTGYGERWFCTEREAIDAGWRKARE